MGKFTSRTYTWSDAAILTDAFAHAVVTKERELLHKKKKVKVLQMHVYVCKERGVRPGPF